MMRISKLLKLMLAAAMPLYATDDETASAAPSSTEVQTDQAQSVQDAQTAASADAVASAASDAQPVDATATVTDTEPAADTTPTVDAAPVAAAVTAVTAVDASTASTDSTDSTANAAPQVSGDTSTDSTVVTEVTAEDATATAGTAPVVQTPTAVAEPGNADDPVLDTVKTPAHNVAEEIHAVLKEAENLPAEMLAWLDSKFDELKTQIKALL